MTYAEGTPDFVEYCILDNVGSAYYEVLVPDHNVIGVEVDPEHFRTYSQTTNLPAADFLDCINDIVRSGRIGRPIGSISIEPLVNHRDRVRLAIPYRFPLQDSADYLNGNDLANHRLKVSFDTMSFDYCGDDVDRLGQVAGAKVHARVEYDSAHQDVAELVLDFAAHVGSDQFLGTVNNFGKFALENLLLRD